MRQRWLERIGLVVGGIAVGAALEALIDPRRGAARRALVRARTRSLVRKGRLAAGRTARDVSHRLAGAWYEARARLHPVPVDDDVLLERVRAHLGRPLTRPRAVEVSSHEGIVTLRGRIPSGELPPLIATVAHVRGVRRVVNELRAT